MKESRKRTGMLIIMGFSILFTASCELLTEEVIREGDVVGTWSFEDATAQVYVGNVNITRLLVVTYGLSQEEAEVKMDSLVDDFLEETGETLVLNADHTYLIDGEGDNDEAGTWEFDAQKDALRLTRSGAEVPEKYTVKELTQQTMILVMPSGFEVLDLDGDGALETNCTIVGELHMKKIQPVN
ncbi:MAG: hypothetical protein P1P82_14655 [Bacteroidales bacterium]|nr:hypothetical protein [Bacteroidales bacterium]MDT8432328.1 hypothetical protein [Bacteroidales bacterium]